MLNLKYFLTKFDVYLPTELGLRDILGVVEAVVEGCTRHTDVFPLHHLQTLL